MASWKDRRTGKYRYEFQYLGKRYGKAGFATKREAKRAEGEHQRSLETDPTPPSPPTSFVSDSETLTLGELMVRYLRPAERGLADVTLRYRKTVFRRFLDHLGEGPAASVTESRIEDYLLTRPSNNQFNKERTEIMRLFSWALRRRPVPHNPVLLVDKLSVERRKKVIPTPQEMARILMAAGPQRPLLLVLFHTMARIDEVLRLKWEDVNFTEKTVRLWTRKRRGGNWEFDWLPMNGDLEKVLWGIWQKRQQDEWVFYNDKTRTRFLYRPKLMKTACKQAGVPKYGFHTIRHFVASYLYDQKKVSLPVISKLLRHKNLQTTERYLQVIDPRFRDTMRLLEGDALTLMQGIETEKSPSPAPSPAQEIGGKTF
jgi:integrase